MAEKEVEDNSKCKCLNPKPFLLFIILIFLFVLITSSVLAATNCWDYTTDTNCTDNSCNWHKDPFGSDWCEDLDCWSFWTEEECTDSVSTYDLACSWKSGTSMSGWCGETSCWNYEGTNESTCVNTSAEFGLSCTWKGNDGDYNCMGPWERNCYEYTTNATCLNSSGCSWGMCWEVGCWDYTSEGEGACNTASNCVWNNDGWCEEDSCWSFRYNTTAACENTSDTKSCKWNSNYGGYCEELTCHSFDYNQTGCESPGGGLDCDWESSSRMCMEKGCWSYTSEGNCIGKVAQGRNCSWQVSTMDNTGWCEKIGCWSFDNVSVTFDGSDTTNLSYCINNTYNLSCTYESNGGWCFQNISAMGCPNMTDQRKCWDTMWCFWDDVTETCNDPGDYGTTFQGGAIGGSGGGSDFKSPPCGVFYLNDTSCNATVGCYYNYTLNTTARCVNNDTTILTNGLNCTLINDSEVCNSIPFMPHCCEWQAGSCAENKFSTSCWDNLATPPDGASYCEDTESYSSESKCNQIANYPWYMPCVWNNDTGKKRCEFANDFFSAGLLDDEKGDLDLLDNKMACEKGGGGTWITETYCGTGNISNMSITVGRCVPKLGVAGGNCDIDCGNCEHTSSGTNHSTASSARSACEDSDLGFCEWTTDSAAENGFGYCKPKQEFKSGALKKCTSTNCDACNFYNAGKRKEKCIDAVCQWTVDPEYPTDTSKGSCIKKGGKTCSDDCAACKTNTSCITLGRGGNETGAFACTWDATFDMCKKVAGNSSTNSEICFDGIDNDNDGMVDCGDSGCYTDSFCGGDTMIDCSPYNTNQTCEETTGCKWFTDGFGSWCDMKSATCFQYDNDETGCIAINDSCEWSNTVAGATTTCMLNGSVTNLCGPLNSSDCVANSDCIWFSDQWTCTHKYQVCMMNYTISADQDSCNAANETVGVACSWKTPTHGGSGWCSTPCVNLGDNCGNDPLCEAMGGGGTGGFCNPIGFGGGGGEMFDCWQYDNNQTNCDNSTSCSWMVEYQPFCDMMMGFDCGQFGNDATTCNANGNCTFINESLFDDGSGRTGTWCGMKMDQCFMNSSLQGSENADLCNANPNCNYSTSWNSCEPTMFSEGATDESSCTIAGGMWRTGWCNHAGMAGMFTGMEMHSPPVMLGIDPCPETSLPEYVDICGAGLKDSGDSWGLGISVKSIKDAAICNGINTENGSGTGTADTKFYWYLDTDSIPTGGCDLDDDASSVGWDLYFQYFATYVNGSLTETRTAYRCLSSNWTIANIELSSWKEKMCSDLGGAMVAVSTDDLAEFEDLLNLSSQIRFYVATANSSTNSSSPSDKLGPVYYTPGTIDFMPECCWALSDVNIDCDMDGLSPSNDPDCSFMKKDGYIKFEDCWGDGIDDDGDGDIDCDDPDCKGNTYCDENDLGVESATYTDTTAPRILFWQAEKYPDSALLSFDTNEPTNGTVLFYKNSSGCAVLNTTLGDIGIWNDDTPIYKSWHEVEVYNDGGTNSLDYALTGNKTYFYKFRNCDDSDNCAQSACANFTTAISVDNCKKCYFLFNMELPDGVTLDIDLDEDGTYESELHRQCGSSAGFLVNYTQARSVNMRFTSNLTTLPIQIYLMGARLTRTIMHNQEIRKINKGGGIQANTTDTTAGATAGYAGLDREIANKLIDKLHPKYCMINISGTQNSLYHCDDDLGNCADKSTTTGFSINASGSNYRIWKMPCVFSVYAGGKPGTASPTTPSTSAAGGGGGGAGGLGKVTPTYSASHYYSSLQKDSITTMEVGREEIAFVKNIFTVNKDLSGVTVTVKRIDDETSVPSGLTDIYQYLEVKLDKMTSEDVTKASIEFRVNSSWITSNNYDENSVVLNRHNNGWNELPTEFVSKDDAYHNYKAGTPGFSYFAIIAKAEKEVAEEVTGAAVVTPPEEKKPVVTPPAVANYVWLIVLIAVVAMVLVYLLVKKKKY